MRFSNFDNPVAAWNRNFTLVAVSVFGFGTFLGVHFALFNNFIVTRLGIEAHHLGYVESLREVPGFLNALFIAVMVRLAPSFVGAVALAVMGLGVMAYSQVDSVASLAVWSVVWSLGFHCYMPMQAVLALRHSPEGKKGRWLGQLSSVNGGACLLAICASMVLLSVVEYEGMYVLAGATVILGGLALLFLPRQRPVEGEKGFVLKKRFSYYYALQFLQGCRRQMFLTFAIFAMVKVHGMPVETTMVLILINQIITTAVAPTLGRLVDHFGERIMLSASYVGLILVFSGYGIIVYLPALYVLYCLDNLIFFGDIAMTTYVNKIASDEDLKPTLAMGVTMNHVAAVIAPVTGGLVWHYFGYQIIFFAGAGLAFISLLVSQGVSAEKILAADAETAGAAVR